MRTAAALLLAQPAAFWLAVLGVLLSAALASGRRLPLLVAAGVLPGVAVGAAAPGAVWAQAAAALAGVSLAPLVLLAGGRLRRPLAAVAASSPSGDARLLGRTARTRGAFRRGEGDVEVDGRARPARCLPADGAIAPGALVRIVRVGDAGLVVRPLHTRAG